MPAEFEDILHSVGDFGLYQKLMAAVFLLPVGVMNPFFFFGIAFMTSTPDHWCHVPEVASSNLSLAEQKALIRPKKDPRCTMNDVDYHRLLTVGKLNHSEEWPTKMCDKGWQFDRTNYDATASTRWNLVCNDSHYSSLVVSLAFAGDVIGTPLFGHFSEKYGRRRIFFFLCAVTAATEISSVLQPIFCLFIILRAISGSVVSVLFINAYVTLLELVAIAKRTHINAICTGSWSFGLCLLPLLAWVTRHWIRLSLCFTASALSLFAFWRLFPESPRWLISHGRYEEAKEVLCRISRWNNMDAHKSEELEMQIHMLGEQMKKEDKQAKQPTLCEILKYPRIFKTFCLINCCWIGNSLPYFGLLLNVRNLGGNEFLNFFYLSVLAFPSQLLTWFCMEKFGRRWTSVCAPLITALACLVPFFLPTEMVTVQIVASLFGRFGATSAYMVLYQQCPELYPTPFRTLGMSLSSTIGSSSSLCVPFIVDLSQYGKKIPFLVFSASSLFASVCSFFLPETLNRALPQTLQDAELYGKEDKYFSFNRKKVPLNNNNNDMAMDSVTEFTATTKFLFSSLLLSDQRRKSEPGNAHGLSYRTFAENDLSPPPSPLPSTQQTNSYD